MARQSMSADKLAKYVAVLLLPHLALGVQWAIPSSPRQTCRGGAMRVYLSSNMAALIYALITFVCTVTCAVLGTTIRTRLPETHLNKESQDVIRLGMGLVATMTALL